MRYRANSNGIEARMGGGQAVQADQADILHSIPIPSLLFLLSESIQ
jgi:hypothetical protein